ncbi:MAG TPA: SxtJ family membrane protein [Methylomirabilota bacterium]|nr:SxtJ family membrane protein [Methylomirabilota bacterium]
MSPAREERGFGLALGTVGALVAAHALWRGRGPVALGAGVLAGVLLGAALVAPAILRWPRRGWMRLAHALGWVNTRILLSVVFFLIVTPVGVVLRLCGWDPLGRRPAGAGWTSYPERRRDPRHYEKMY